MYHIQLLVNIIMQVIKYKMDKKRKLYKKIGGEIYLFEKNMSFETSEKFFEILENKLINLNPLFNGYYNVFTGCREQGLQLTMYADNDVADKLCIWSCMGRNSDQIMVVIADSSCSNSNNNMFDDKSFNSAKYFNYGDYDKATEYALNVIKKKFPRYLNTNYNCKFNCNRNLVDLEKIIADAENFNYEDHHNLASFEEENFLCNLIIMDGKVGLQYSKYLDDDHNELENLYFEKFVPDLTSGTTLMLGMKQKLNNFINNGIEYDIQIKI